MRTRLRVLAAAALFAALPACQGGESAPPRDAAPPSVRGVAGPAASSPKPTPVPAPETARAAPGERRRLEREGAAVAGAAWEKKSKMRDGTVAEARLAAGDGDTEGYAVIDETGFRRLPEEAVSTFSIDVDTASYANVRRFLNEGRLPPAGAVRLEELLNYFPTADAPPADGRPFAVHVESAACPWAMEHRLVRVALKAREVSMEARPAANLVFLVDVSGSMNQENKLPLLQQCLKLLTEQLQPADKVSMVVYAGAAGLVLPPTSGELKPTIADAVDALRAGGSTNGGEGIRLAYTAARENYVKGGVNRVVLCTDGDFNVGTTNRSDLEALIRREAESGVFLSVLGFGTGNLKDDTMETLADRGNGNYAYVDSLAEGRRILVEQAGGTLVTVAKDVKLQIEFNPAQVAGWRLVGYENRLLAREDFRDDRKDAGEMGAGHSVTAFYEVVPAGRPVPGPDVEPLKYQQPGGATAAASSGELMTVRARWKLPEEGTSTELETAVVDRGASYSAASADFKFQASVAAFGMLLRDSKWKGTASWDSVIELAGEGTGYDPGGYRREFVALAHKAKALTPQAR